MKLCFHIPDIPDDATIDSARVVLRDGTMIPVILCNRAATMTIPIIEKIQAVEVKAGSKYFIMMRVLDGYEADSESKAEIVNEVKDAFEMLGASIEVAILQGLEIVRVEKAEG